MENASQLMENNEFAVASRQVLNLVSISNLSSYDCEFIALARDLGVKLVTVDQKNTEMFPQYALPLQGFTSDA